jgi:hypothetical protein
MVDGLNYGGADAQTDFATITYQLRYVCTPCLAAGCGCQAGMCFLLSPNKHFHPKHLSHCMQNVPVQLRQKGLHESNACQFNWDY